jgi:hypothetical protein
VRQAARLPIRRTLGFRSDPCALTMEQKILNWLSKHGFPFEMRVAQKMSARTFQVTQSPYYSDFQTGEPREIDLLCRLYALYEPPKEIAMSELELFCAVECKASGSPWVVFKQTEANSWNTDQVIASRTGRKLLQKTRKGLKGSGIETSARSAGYGVREAFADSDRAFTALMQALKASEATIVDANSIEEKLNTGGDDFVNIYSALALPVVAITAPLFECTLDEGGDPKLQTVDLSSVVLRYPRTREGAGQGAVVYIVTEGALPKFMDWVFEYFELLKPSLGAMLPLDQ